MIVRIPSATCPGLLVFGCMLFAFDAAGDEVNGIVLPQFRALGKMLNEEPLFKQESSMADEGGPTSDKSIESKYPNTVSIEVHKGRIEGFQIHYGEDVSLQQVVTAIAIDQREAKHNEAVARQLGVWMWRHEKGRYTVSASASDEGQGGVNVIATWLDRRDPESYSGVGVGAIKKNVEGVLDGSVGQEDDETNE